MFSEPLTEVMLRRLMAGMKSTSRLMSSLGRRMTCRMGPLMLAGESVTMSGSATARLRLMAPLALRVSVSVGTRRPLRASLTTIRVLFFRPRKVHLRELFCASAEKVAARATMIMRSLFISVLVLLLFLFCLFVHDSCLLQVFVLRQIDAIEGFLPEERFSDIGFYHGFNQVLL